MDAASHLESLDRVTETPDAVAARLTLAEALARLTPRQRAVLAARFYQDRTEVDAARVLARHGRLGT